MKIWAYLALAVVMIGGAKWAHSTTYNAGWNAAVVEQTVLIQNAQNDAVAKALTEWQKTAALAEREIVIEERIVEVIRVVEKEIPVVVERIVTITPECSDLGNDFAGLLNAQVNSIPGLQNHSSGSAPEFNP